VQDAGASQLRRDGRVCVAGTARGDAGHREGGKQQRDHLPADYADVLIASDLDNLCQGAQRQVIGA
jgi:hypothetical protein